MIDTNIIIDHLRNAPQATKQLKEIENGNFDGLISTITVMELFAAPRLNQKRIATIKSLLEIFEHIPVDGRIAAASGKLLSTYRASHGLDPMDAIIASTAILNEAVLFTLNTRHFRFIEGLVSINPYKADD
ncbi:type II toxin-antitoxin system VapC family toxin [Desulfocucumis palustris]|uniref:type II toxin-antitoxin system VapC family toxin n=1 Tax=Desulfocucumis palustris TaxID=1898651 RepID=UPI001E405757|nr:type II toxin-antitoxin system VapC family toxin [Desulfocucumis palustris]